MIKWLRDFRGIIDTIYLRIKQQNLYFCIKSPIEQVYGIEHNFWFNRWIGMQFYDLPVHAEFYFW